MKKSSKYKNSFCSLFAGVLILTIFTGCTPAQSASQSADMPKFHDIQDLGGGLALSVTDREIEDDTLCAFTIECVTDGSAFDTFAFAADAEDADGYLLHDADDQKYDCVQAMVSDDCTIYFDRPQDVSGWSGYTLHFTCSATTQANDETTYTVAVPLAQNKTELNKTIGLPLNNSIQVTQVEKQTGYPEFSDTCADIYFTISAGISNFSIYVDSSAVVTGQEPGTLTKEDETHYIYSHPIEETEEEIVLSFRQIGIADQIIYDIAL